MATPDSPPSVEGLRVSRAHRQVVRGIDYHVTEREVAEACLDHA